MLCGVEAATQGLILRACSLQATMSRSSSLSSEAGPPANGDPNCVPAALLAKQVSCGLCHGPVASSLLLSCSHLFCGDCISKHLSEKPSCPTCNMDLRAVPVRCLAMDKVAAFVVPSLATEQQQHYAKRKKDGQCAADKVNKMFWYLAPSALPAAAGAAGLPLPGAAPLVSSCAPHLPAASMAFSGTTLIPGALSLDPTALHSRQQQHFGAGQLGLQMGCICTPASGAMPGHLPNAAATAAANAGPLLQLAVAAQQMAHAQQVAQMQQLAQVQQQMSSVSLNPACRPIMAAQDAPYGLVSQPLAMPGMPGYQDLQQFSSMVGGMCQV